MKESRSSKHVNNGSGTGIEGIAAEFHVDISKGSMHLLPVVQTKGLEFPSVSLQEVPF